MFAERPTGRRTRLVLLAAGPLVGAGLVLSAGPAAAAGPVLPMSSLLDDADESKGELLPADADLVVKVRLAGLWENPAGKMAVEKAGSPTVRKIGAMIAEQHVELDRLVVEAANDLNIPLPDEPNADQKKWLQEMEDASEGDEFDQVFVDRLRSAHGKIFPAIGAVRTGTRNDTVRLLAAQSNGFVLTHLTLLESTDLVDFEELPPPPDPAKAAASGTANTSASTGSGLLSGASARSEVGGVSMPVIWIILATALIAGAIGMTRFVRPHLIGGRHGQLQPQARMPRQEPGPGRFQQPQQQMDYDYPYPRRNTRV